MVFQQNELRHRPLNLVGNCHQLLSSANYYATQELLVLPTTHQFLVIRALVTIYFIELQLVIKHQQLSIRNCNHQLNYTDHTQHIKQQFLIVIYHQL